MKLAAHLMAAMVFSAAVCPPLWAQAQQGRNIYTCIDASGVRITSDRLIPQCLDREQRVLGPSGVVRQRIGPAMTEAEMAQHLEARRQQQLAQQREKEKLKEQQRRDQVLLARYPDRASHEAQRRQGMEQLEALLAMSRQRLAELQQQERELQQELEFYAKDASSAPARLTARLQDVQSDISAQQAQVAAHEADQRRIHARFDEELQRLEMLWRQRAAADAANN